MFSITLGPKKRLFIRRRASSKIKPIKPKNRPVNRAKESQSRPLPSRDISELLTAEYVSWGEMLRIWEHIPVAHTANSFSEVDERPTDEEFADMMQLKGDFLKNLPNEMW